jgi:dTDP-4-amino-4,6-dideoxygalactose transaminase
LRRFKLPNHDAHNAERRRIAAVYTGGLAGAALRLPEIVAGAEHVFHLFVVRHPERDRLRAELAAAGIGTLIHYPSPVHLQPAYAHLRARCGALPVTEQLAGEILSLPLYVGLSDERVARVVEAVERCTAGAPA